MKWHKFTAYFGLWLGALFSAGSGLLLVSGLQYGSESQRDMVYQRFTDLQSLDMGIGIVYIGIGLFAIYTAMQLVKLKQGAPQKLMINYLLSAAMPIIYALLGSSVLNVPFSEVITDQYISMISGSVLGIIITRIYYGKREHLFVN